MLTGGTSTSKINFYCQYNNQVLSAYYLDITYDKKPKRIILSNKLSAFEENPSSVSVEYGFIFADVDRKRIDQWGKVSSTTGNVSSCSFVVDNTVCYINDNSARIPIEYFNGTVYYKLLY